MLDRPKSVLIPATSVRSLASAVRNRGTHAKAAGLDFEAASSTEDRELFERLDDTMSSAVQVLGDADHGDGVLVAPENPLACLLQSFLAERGSANFSDLVRQGKLQSANGDAYEAKFDEHDVVGWALNFLPAWLKGRFSKRAFVPPKESVTTIPNAARIAILGDWGSSMYGAPVCAASIEKAQPAFTTLIHLGDVYYAGTSREVEERFLAAWPTVAGATSWAANSNHEMYSGGEGYFEKTLKDPRFTQGSSCFALQNDHFLFLGLDTGYTEHDLDTTQLEWIRRRVAESGTRKLVLLSHHQPFSQFESGGERLVAKLASLLASKRVLAWYWGHEHRCVFFDRHPDWALWGRCIGHSGFPSFRDIFQGSPERKNADGSTWWRTRRDGSPSAIVLDGSNPYVQTHGNKYAPNGYVSLALDGPMIHETVHAADGASLLGQTLDG
jgi:hypothetical protein